MRSMRDSYRTVAKFLWEIHNKPPHNHQDVTYHTDCAGCNWDNPKKQGRK